MGPVEQKESKLLPWVLLPMVLKAGNSGESMWKGKMSVMVLKYSQINHELGKTPERVWRRLSVVAEAWKTEGEMLQQKEICAVFGALEEK